LAGNTTTLGRIGTGFMYADWKSQVAYSSPNWNGFQFTAGVTQSWNPRTVVLVVQQQWSRRSTPAFEGKASYEWTGDVAGKVWASAISQKVRGLIMLSCNTGGTSLGDDRATAWDIGTTVNVAGLGLTGYYGQGEGIGHTGKFVGGYDAMANVIQTNGMYKRHMHYQQQLKLV
jgi:predicted porin